MHSASELFGRKYYSFHHQVIPMTFATHLNACIQPWAVCCGSYLLFWHQPSWVQVIHIFPLSSLCISKHFFISFFCSLYLWSEMVNVFLRILLLDWSHFLWKAFLMMFGCSSGPPNLINCIAFKMLSSSFSFLLPLILTTLKPTIVLWKVFSWEVRTLPVHQIKKQTLDKELIHTA